MIDFETLVMDGDHEIPMSAVDAAEAIKADPKRYSYAMVDVVDSAKRETVSLRKTDALSRIKLDPVRFSMSDKKPVAAPVTRSMVAAPMPKPLEQPNVPKLVDTKAPEPRK